MDIKAKIEECLNDLENDSFSVATLMKKCYRIACEAKDVLHQVWYEINFLDLLSENNIDSKLFELKRKINSASSNNEEVKFQWKKIKQEYFEVRSVPFIEYGQTQSKQTKYLASVDAIESELSSLSIALEKNTITTGLHPVDAYKAQDHKRKIDFMLNQNIRNFKTIVNRLRTKEYEFLIDLNMRIGDSREKITIENNRKIFVIHGHNEAKRRELKEIIEKFDLEPLVLLDELDGGARTIIEKFEDYAKQCCYAIAIFTPDDTVTKSKETYLQARPNAIFEIGWFCGKLGRERVMLLMHDHPSMTVFSDFNGILQKRFSKDIKEVKTDIENELKKIGILKN
jgi:hypothetical protein